MRINRFINENFEKLYHINIHERYIRNFDILRENIEFFLEFFSKTQIIWLICLSLSSGSVLSFEGSSAKKKMSFVFI